MFFHVVKKILLWIDFRKYGEKQTFDVATQLKLLYKGQPVLLLHGQYPLLEIKETEIIFATDVHLQWK